VNTPSFKFIIYQLCKTFVDEPRRTVT